MRKLLTHAYQDIISVENLLVAWQEFKNGKRGKPDVAEFEARLMDNLFELHGQLSSYSYQHSGYDAFKINDPKPRDIHKALVRDRLMHHAIYHQLYWFFDRTFIYNSYSCRRFRGTHRALDQFKRYSRIVSKNNTKTCWVLKCDIRKFFASIAHDILKQILRSHIDDGDTLGLLENIIDSFCTSGVHGSPYRGDPVGDFRNPPRSGEGYKNSNYPLALQALPLDGGDGATKYNANKKGLPLGNLTSQLLVNVYMNRFDQFVKHRLKQKILYSLCR